MKTILKPIPSGITHRTVPICCVKIRQKSDKREIFRLKSVFVFFFHTRCEKFRCRKKKKNTKMYLLIIKRTKRIASIRARAAPPVRVFRPFRSRPFSPSVRRRAPVFVFRRHDYERGTRLRRRRRWLLHVSKSFCHAITFRFLSVYTRTLYLLDDDRR